MPTTRWSGPRAAVYLHQAQLPGSPHHLLVRQTAPHIGPMPEAPTQTELDRARQLWSGEQEACVGFARDNRPSFSAAYDGFRDRVPETGIDEVEQLAPASGKSIGYGYLTEKEKADGGTPAASLSAFLERLQLADVLWTSACLSDDSAANQTLAALVNDDIRNWATSKWRRSLPDGVVQETIDNVTSSLYEPSRQGLNAERPRLQTYYGRCTLFGWLQFVAQRALIDRKRRNRERAVESEAFDTHAAAEADAGVSAEQREASAALRRSVGAAYQQLWDRLTTERSRRQQEFAYLKYIAGLSHSEIAQRLGVGMPRVTELAQAVCTKFLHELKAVDPIFADVQEQSGGDRASRKVIEQMLHEFLSEDATDDESR